MRNAHRLLREATRDAHEALDALFTGFDLTAIEGYRRFIGAQADALLPAEAALDAANASAVLEDWPSRRRGHLLAADRDALGLSSQILVEAPSLGEPAATAGALYVLEGSRHGARHLRRMVPAGSPISFLDTDQPAGKWTKLLDRIDAILYDTPSADTAIASALAIFAMFDRSGRTWLVKEQRDRTDP
ncbi:biliverdin-producing heme oxygenase [Sphingomonas sp.]